MPISVKICQKYAITSINNIIQNSMYSASKNIKSEDFILRSDNNGRLEYLSVNSIIVNNICAETASMVSKNLNNLTTSKIRLPLGVFTAAHILHAYMESRKQWFYFFDRRRLLCLHINDYRLDASIATQLKKLKIQFIDKNREIVISEKLCLKI